MRNKLLFLLAVMLFFGGLGVLLYPSLKTAALRREERRVIESFEQYRASAPVPSFVEPVDEQCETVSQTGGNQPERIFPELWDACVAFNEQLPTTQRTAYTADSLRQPSIKASDFGWEQEAFGFLSIPTADIEAPVYLGASSANMDKGAAVLGQTSLPIGGDSTNCVIAGHRTWSSTVRFKGLEQINFGDKVYLTNPWETLVYEAIEIKTVLPDTQDEIMVQKGRDLLTVFTCTGPSTHRFMVICARVQKKGSNLRTDSYQSDLQCFCPTNKEESKNENH